MEMKFYTDFMAYVDSDDFAAAASGDVSAKHRIAESLDGVELYLHNFNPGRGRWVGVTLADLICHGIIPRVTLHKDE